MKALLFLSILFISCNYLSEQFAPDDFAYHPMSITQPAVACDDTTEVTQPEFITIYNEYFNGLPDSLVYYFHVGNSDTSFTTLRGLLEAQGYHPDSIQVYEEGNSIAAIVRGTNDKSNLEGRIWTYDGLDIASDKCDDKRQKAIFAINIQGFMFGGALNFEEYKQVAIHLQSVRSFNFRNTHWTQQEYEEIASIILGECKLGRRDANFMFNAFPVSDSLYCKFIQFDWEFVRGQIENCGEPFTNKIFLKT